MHTDNQTLYEIKDYSERSILVLWSTIVFLSSLIGDSIILISICKYNALQQHKVVLAVMQHMAICDLLQTVFRVFPNTLALVNNGWVMGKLLCHVEEFIGVVGNIATFLLTCTLTTIKLLVVKFPLRTGTWSFRLGNKICAVVWVLSLCWYAPSLMVVMIFARDTLHFSYRDYQCNYDYNSPNLSVWFLKYHFISLCFIVFLTYATVIITSALLLMVAKLAADRHCERLRWEGVRTVLLTVGVFLLSYLPWSAIFFTSMFMGVEYSPTTNRAVLYLEYLNITANFFVYSLSIRSFRKKNST